MDVVIDRVSHLPREALAPLIAESERDGWQFVRRLADEWISGANRFDKPDEALFVASADGVIVGVCGLNADPHRQFLSQTDARVRGDVRSDRPLPRVTGLAGIVRPELPIS